MNPYRQAEMISKQLRGRGTNSKVYFFDGVAEYTKAKREGFIQDKDICFIDDVTEMDN